MFSQKEGWGVGQQFTNVVWWHKIREKGGVRRMEEPRGTKVKVWRSLITIWSSLELSPFVRSEGPLRIVILEVLSV